MIGYASFVNGPWTGKAALLTDICKPLFVDTVVYLIHKFLIRSPQQKYSVVYVACVGQLSTLDGTEAIMIAVRHNIPYQEYNCATV